MQIINKNINELIPYINNPRKNDKAVDYVASSIKNFGFKVPIIIDAQNEIVAGHTRLKAAIKLNYKEVPCLVADDLTPAQIKAYRIADNKVSELAEWDIDLLKIELQDLDEFTGFELEELNIMFEEEKEIIEDEVPEIQKEVITKLGDLYEIGEHRLLCGDSTDGEQVAKLMNGQEAVLAHNDPPYGMKKEKDGVTNDNLNYDDLLEFNKKWIKIQFQHLKDNGSWYCWGIDEPLMDIYSEILKPYIAEQKATFRNLITWDKGHGQGQNQENTRSYAIADEKCLFAMMGVQGFNNNADNYFEGFEKIRQYLVSEKEKSELKNEQITKLTATTHTHYWSRSQWAFPTKEHYEAIQKAVKNDAFKKEYDELKKEYEEIKKEYEEIKKEYYGTRAYFNNTHDNFNNVWHFDRTKDRSDTGGHATPKPIPLCERAIKSSCPDGGLVIDFFLGSGTTMVASQQLNRKCYGMELDPKYCDVIIRRMINLDLNITIKRNGLDCKQEFIK